MMESSFRRLCNASLSALVIFGLGRFACLTVRTTSLLSSDAFSSVRDRHTTSVLAMISATGNLVGVRPQPHGERRTEGRAAFL